MSIAGYYLNLMIRFWKGTIKIFLHYAGLRKSVYSEISVDELYDCVNSNQPPLLIDIRSPAEFTGGYGHIPNARSIPMLELESALEDLDSFKEKEIMTMCPGGGMSLVAYDIMTKAGFTDVKSLTGGTDAWNAKGYPITMD